MPSLSAILPTADRRAFLPHAIAAFLGQTCGDAELIVLDDGADPVADLIPADPRIRYVRDDTRRPLGAKRNRLCELARGDVIVHWDDDDWHAPDRLARQRAAMTATGADVCGLDRVQFLAEDGSAAWDYTWAGRGAWVYGATFAYRRDFWRRHPFAEVQVGEDTRFVMGVPGARVHAMADNDWLIARVHAGNTSPKRTEGAYWRRRDPAPLVARMVAARSPPAIAVPSPAPPTPLANVHAALVHERPECVVDLVRNLRHLDPASPILLYDGSPRGDLLDPRLPWARWGAEIVPRPRPMRWGALHGFALDCIAHLGRRDYDTLTIVDSDQLLLRPSYPAFLAARLGDRARLGVLASDATVQGLATRIPPAAAAQRERALWQPLLRRFADGEAKFVHWSFWPGTVIGADAARAIAALFADDQVAAILARSRLWATEEVLFPTFAALLGFDVRRNPCVQEWVQFRRGYSRSDADRAFACDAAFWMHPVARAVDDPLRGAIRRHHADYRSPTLAPTAAADRALVAAVREHDGWLPDDEALLLIATARAATAGPDAAAAIAEVGAFCGKATVLLALAAPTARVTAIDRFDGAVGARDGRLEQHGPTRARFDRAVAQHGMTERVAAVVGDAGDRAWPGRFDLVVIDGLHDYAAVAADFWALAPTLNGGGRVAFHDYAGYFPGVVAFVDELIADGGWMLTAQCSTLVVLERRKSAGTAAEPKTPPEGDQLDI